MTFLCRNTIGFLFQKRHLISRKGYFLSTRHIFVGTCTILLALWGQSFYDDALVSFNNILHKKFFQNLRKFENEMRPHNIFDPIVAGSHAYRLMVKLFICFLFKYDDEQCNKYYVCMYIVVLSTFYLTVVRGLTKEKTVVYLWSIKTSFEDRTWGYK